LSALERGFSKGLQPDSANKPEMRLPFSFPLDFSPRLSDINDA
jgi:hypothetical protein